jgi:hypothetical protein
MLDGVFFDGQVLNCWMAGNCGGNSNSHGVAALETKEKTQEKKIRLKRGCRRCQVQSVVGQGRGVRGKIRPAGVWCRQCQGKGRLAA